MRATGLHFSFVANRAAEYDRGAHGDAHVTLNDAGKVVVTLHTPARCELDISEARRLFRALLLAIEAAEQSA